MKHSTPYGRHYSYLLRLAHEQRAQMMQLDRRGITGAVAETLALAHATTRSELYKIDAARRALMTAPGGDC